MKPVKSYIWKYWYAYLFGILFLMTSVSLDMLSPQITKRIIDDVITGGQMELLTQLLLTILMIGVGRAIFQYAKEMTFDLTSQKISVRIRQDLFRHIQSLSVNYFDKTNTGELMARLKDDVDILCGGLGYIGMLMIEVVFHTTLVMYNMIKLSPVLAVLPILFMPVVGTLAVVLEKKLDKVYSDISEENAKLNTVAQENLAGVRTVKAFAREKFEIGKFLSHNKRYYELNMKQSKVWVKYFPFFQFISAMLPVATTILGGFEVLNGKMDIGSLFAYVEYSRNCTWPMQMVGWLTNDVSSAIASKKKLDKIVKETAHLTEPANPVILDEIRGEVAFENVSFSMDDKEILKDISFVVPEGKTLGIMGATGSGKSTIINLLQRFYDPSEGAVALDGVDVKELSFKQVRGSNAVVLQDVFLFSDTIAENIKMGQKDTMTQEEIEAAVAFAQASDFIEEMEEKYETVIGERGVGLSGGQKQRISIARAVAKHAPILVMDDATSALDMETEREIQKELEQLKDTTKIIIAHRISAVRHADEIIYLKDGQIAERGTHEQLLEKKGLYYETYKVQYGETVLT